MESIECKGQQEGWGIGKPFFEVLSFLCRHALTDTAGTDVSGFTFKEMC